MCCVGGELRRGQDDSEPGPAGLDPDGGGIEARLLGERAAAAVALERAHGQVVDVKVAHGAKETGRVLKGGARGQTENNTKLAN